MAGPETGCLLALPMKKIFSAGAPTYLKILPSFLWKSNMILSGRKSRISFRLRGFAGVAAVYTPKIMTH